MQLPENMPAGRDMDALVAKAIGVSESDAKSYSTDVGSAWLVVEYLESRGCDDFGLTWSRHNAEDFMFAMNVPRHVSGSVSFGMPDPVVCHGDTAAEAICRAALRALPH